MSYEMNEEEKQFLLEYNIEEFERPSVATDIVVFRITEEEEPNKKKKPPKKLQILLIKRATYPYKNHWVLPGGFCMSTEKVEETASRELYEETNIKNVNLNLIGVYSEPNRDPRGWIISNTFMALINKDDCVLRTDKEAWEARWFSKEEVEELDLGFDHQKIVKDAFLQLKYYAENYSERIFDLLPPTFTLNDLHQVYEQILEKEITLQNFRRKMVEFLEETDEIETGFGHRNSKKYRYKK